MRTAPTAHERALLPAERRVRHQARDAAVLMSFSLGMSLLCAAVFLLLAGLGR